MRAFMSRRDERDERTTNAGTMGDLGVAWNAEREARAILAETEPRNGSYPDCWYEVPVRLMGHIQGDPLNGSRFILAESLAAFIEQEL